MRQRLISAAVLVTVVVVVFLAGQPWLTIGIAALAGVAAYECSGLIRRAGFGVDTLISVAVAMAAVLAMPLMAGQRGPLSWQLLGGALALVVGGAAALALRERDPAAGFRRWSGTTIGALYPALLAFVVGIVVIAPGVQPGSLLGAQLDGGRAWLLVLVLTVWTLDSAAYLAGRFHGQGHFFNHISPSKTWSGALGGTAAAIVVCAVLVAALGRNPAIGLVLGAIIAISAQVGDLAASMLKRAAGAKDSSRLIPGHGGFLDRLDSFILAAPAAFVALALLPALGPARPG